MEPPVSDSAPSRVLEDAPDEDTVPASKEINKITSNQVASSPEKPLSTAQQTTPVVTGLTTHPALSSHALTWREMAAFTQVVEPPIPSEKITTDGAFVVENLPFTDAARTVNNSSRLFLQSHYQRKEERPRIRQRGGHTARRGNGFSKGEMESLLELLQEHLPLAKDEWEKVARLHELRYPQQSRNADAIRRKFSALCRTVPLTGDPSIPDDVLKAKEIRKAMTERADIGDGNESEDEYTEEIQEDTTPFSRGGTPATLGSTASIVTDTVEEGENTPSISLPSTSKQPTLSPRPLIRKRPAKTPDDEDSILSAMKASMLQEQMRRDAEYRQRIIDTEEERERREEERLLREQERQDERERRDE